MQSTAIVHARKGMRVVDAAGDQVGTVDMVQMGDPDAVTTEGQTTGDTDAGIPSRVAEAFVGGAEPHLGPSAGERLRRLGFVKIDSKGLFSKDRYAAAEDIARVEADTVHLAKSRDELPTEA